MAAYAEMRLLDAMENVGEMSDFAVHDMKVPLSQFWPLFAASDIAAEVERGSWRVIDGLSGTELALRVGEQSGLMVPGNGEPRELLRRAPGRWGLSRAYWCGWILAYYQWRCNQTFLSIERELPINQVERMYRMYHEQSEERFAEAADELRAQQQCGLQRQRQLVGLSQSQLAHRSGVGIRAIQQYEQGAKDIHRASCENIRRLAQALHCEPRNLLDTPARYEYGIVKLDE